MPVFFRRFFASSSIASPGMNSPRRLRASSSSIAAILLVVLAREPLHLARFFPSFGGRARAHLELRQELADHLGGLLRLVDDAPDLLGRPAEAGSEEVAVDAGCDLAVRLHRPTELAAGVGDGVRLVAPRPRAIETTREQPALAQAVDVAP